MAATSIVQYPVRDRLARSPAAGTVTLSFVWTTAEMSCETMAVTTPAVNQAPTAGGTQNAPRIGRMPMASADMSSPAMIPPGCEKAFPRVMVALWPVELTRW